MTDQSKNTSTSLLGSIGLLDRAWEANWSLRLLLAVLFIDLAMCIIGESGLLDWSPAIAPMTENIGSIVFTALAFALFASVLLPFISEFLREIALYTPLIRTLPDSLYPTTPDARPYLHVSLSELKHYAFKNNSEYWLNKCESVKEHHRCSRNKNLDLSNLMIGVILLGLANWHSKLLGIDNNTILTTISKELFPNASFSIGLILLAICIGIAFATWGYSYQRLWIEHHTLFHELHPPKNAYRGSLKAYSNEGSSSDNN